jgi:hypothetical protein
MEFFRGKSFEKSCVTLVSILSQSILNFPIDDDDQVDNFDVAYESTGNELELRQPRPPRPPPPPPKTISTSQLSSRDILFNEFTYLSFNSCETQEFIR